VNSDVLTACVLGPVPYREGLEIQRALVERRAARETGDWLLFPDHPPVLTVGRGGSRESLRAGSAELARRGIEVFEVTRGGDFTWHGPGQLVGYAICDLDRVGNDLHRFLRGIEQALFRTVGRFGVAAHRSPGRTGIWVGEMKLGSIGIAVRRWVSYHGFALNVAPDLSFFDLIHPCGLKGIEMTSLARILGSAPPLAEVREAAAAELAAELGHARVEWAGPERVREVAGALELHHEEERST
jgi:lipoate-protein ligase B